MPLTHYTHDFLVFPVLLMVLLVCLTFSSSDERSVLTTLALVALNSSITDESGRGSLEVLLYRLTVLKDGETPCHFCKNLLHSLSHSLHLGHGKFIE